MTESKTKYLPFNNFSQDPVTFGIQSTPLFSSKPSTMERQTQTETRLPKWKQFLYCLAGDDAFR